MRRRISVATGADLWVEMAGDGLPVVLIHGNMVSAGMWEPQVPALAESFTVIAYDVRGFDGRRIGPDATRTARTSTPFSRS